MEYIHSLISFLRFQIRIIRNLAIVSNIEVSEQAHNICLLLTKPYLFNIHRYTITIKQYVKFFNYDIQILGFSLYNNLRLNKEIRNHCIIILFLITNNANVLTIRIYRCTISVVLAYP